MNTEITRVAESILFLAENKKSELVARYDRATLDDLLHECEAFRRNEDFIVRTAAEIVRYGCTEILDEKPKKI